MDKAEREYRMSVTWDKPTDIVITDPCYLFDGQPQAMWRSVMALLMDATPFEFGASMDPLQNERLRGLVKRTLEVEETSPEILRAIGLDCLVTVKRIGNGMKKNLRWAPVYPDALAPLGISQCLCGDTAYGAWSCWVLEDSGDSGRKIGEFCADDSGMYIVCALDETPENFRNSYIKDKRLAHTFTIIPQFRGTVTCEPIAGTHMWRKENTWVTDWNIRLVGCGNINFHTARVG